MDAWGPQVTISLEVEKAFLLIHEHPPDANRGFELPPAECPPPRWLVAVRAPSSMHAACAHTHAAACATFGLRRYCSGPVLAARARQRSPRAARPGPTIGSARPGLRARRHRPRPSVTYSVLGETVDSERTLWRESWPATAPQVRAQRPRANDAERGRSFWS
jgi:hypothetical protein